MDEMDEPKMKKLHLDRRKPRCLPGRILQNEFGLYNVINFLFSNEI